MEIEVRRNFDITCTVKAECDVNLLNETLGLHDLTESQKKRLEEAEYRWKQFCAMFWEVARAEKMKDLDGNLILETTHEIGYDVGEPDDEGFAEIVKVWVRPKESQVHDFLHWGEVTTEIKKIEDNL